MKTENLKKHHFWLLFGAVPLMVGLLVIMLYNGPADAIGSQEEAYTKRKTEVGSAKASGTGMLAELEVQKKSLEERRGQLWDVNYDRQKAEGVFAWPSASKDRYLKDLEKLDLRFGAEGGATLNKDKSADASFLDVNDEIKKFTDDANYRESYVRLASTISPTKFDGGGWSTVLRHVTNWGTSGRPGWNVFWLALEDFWIQRALLKPISEVNDKAAAFEIVKPAAGTDTPLKRKFQNRTWEIDIEVAVEGPNTVVKSKLKNKTDRLQMLGANKTMRLKVWLEDPKLSNSQYFEYRIGGELVKGSGELVPKVFPEFHKIPAGTNPAEIYKLEQILDEVNVPVRLVRKLELGFRDAKRSAVELKMPSFFPEEVAAEPAGNNMMSMPPNGMVGGDMSGAGGAAARTGTAEQVLLGNRKRYVEATKQVRRMPVGLVLVVDQAYVNDVLIALGNSPLRFQITQTQWQRFRDPLAVGGNSSGGSAPPQGSGSETEGQPSRPGGGGLSPLAPPTNPGSSPGPMYPGGSGSGFPGGSGSGYPGGSSGSMPSFPGAPSGSSTGALPQSQVTAGLVELAVYGLVSLYEKVPLKPTEGAKPVEEPKPAEPKPAPPKPEDPKPAPPIGEEPKPPAVPKGEDPKLPVVPPTAPPK